jgi:hypothetical protein
MFVQSDLLKFEGAALIFHEPNCPGMIVSHDPRQLRCSECGKIVGTIEPAVLRDIIQLLRESAAKLQGSR